MSHIKGWTPVVVWITAGFAMWFFHTIWPEVNAWLQVNQHLSGWMQFAGAVLAILGAFYLGHRQAVAARALVQEQQFVEGLRLMQTIRKVLEHTKHTLRVFREAWQLHGNVRQTIHECKRMKGVIEKIDLVKCNSPALAEYLLQIPQLLDEAVEHQVFATKQYDKVLIAGADEPGRRNQIFRSEMRKTEAIENFIQLAIEQAEAEETAISAMRQHL
jgi:hypothetical protein